MGIAEFSGQWEGRTVDGAYPLRQSLGAGEQSAVFLTTYETRDAAIKLVDTAPQAADAQLARWRAASNLSHPNLIRIFATGRCELDGMALLYVVMERADEDLSQVIPDRPLTTEEARAMLEPTLAALEYIHRQGFGHAHLKPANIMAVDDLVKLSSDGLARLGTDIEGPPTPYDPPERAKVSSASDLWSFGITLVEVLTQQRPPVGRETTLPKTMPEPFASIAMHCLERNPADHWTIAQISQSLKSTSSAAARKKRYFTPVGALIFLVILAALVVGVLARHPDTAVPSATAPAPEPLATEAAKEVTKEVAKAPRANPPAPAPAPEPVAAKEMTNEVAKEPEANPSQANPSQTNPSQPTDQPMPDLSDQARRTIHGKVVVDVRVDVDPSGSVTDAKLDHAGSSKYLAATALSAARQWKFTPVTVNGSEVAQRWRLRFEFRSTGTQARPQRLSPN